MAKGNSSQRQQFTWVLLSSTLILGRLAAQTPEPAKPLTVDQIVEEGVRNQAMPQGMAWSPDGKLLTFIRTTVTPGKMVRGVMIPGSSTSEIWSLNVASGKEELLVSHAQLTEALEGAHRRPVLGEDEDAAKKRQLESYAWSQDGQSLLLASRVALVWFDLDKHTSRPAIPQELATADKQDPDKAEPEEFESPQISPDGRHFAFIQGHRLTFVNLPDRTFRVLAETKDDDHRWAVPDWVYRNEFGMKAAYWWSPDSNALAVLRTDDSAVQKYQMRRADGDEDSIAYPKPGGAIPKVHLMVMPLTGNAVDIDLGSDPNVYLPRVQWLPDGKHLAIERLSRSQKKLELLIADTSTGKTNTILTEQDAYWINVDNGLHFLSDSNRFLWTSERSGYRHLYLYDISGRKLAQLTKGEWEVTSVDGIDESSNSVYFTATEASALERHLYRVSLDGSGMTQVTKSKGTHSAFFAPSGKLFLDTWSDHASAPRQQLLNDDGSKLADIHEKSPAAPTPDPLRQLEFLTVTTHMGQHLHAWMMKPPDFAPAHRYPVIVYAAGGPGEQVVRDFWGGDIELWFSMMAEKGYIVFALDNRGTAGEGHFFEEPIHLRFSATEMADMRDGALFLQSQPWVDRTRIGICGWGFGGFLALHGMLDRPILYKAGFAGSPITDWHLYDAIFTERYLEDPDHNLDGWLSSSPIDNAANLSGPLLIAQATLNEKIHTENSLMLLDELLDKEKYADILLFPDRADLFQDRATRKAMFQRLTDFFLKNL